MQKKLIVRLWLSRLGKYLLIPAALCVVLFPLYSIFHQQTIKVQLSDAEELLATAANTFDGYLYNIRFVTNKLFHDSTITLLAASRDGLSLWSDTTAQTASKKLEDLTYSMSPVAYSYVTFARNQLVIDNTRLWQSYASFYPGTLEYSGVSREDWRRWLRPKQLTCQPVQQILLYQTAYPDNYLTITQPFFDSNNRFMGSCTMLLRERQLIELFLPMEEWRSKGMFYITRSDGQLLQTYHYDPASPLAGDLGNGPVRYNGRDYLLLRQELPDLDAVVTVGLPYELFAENLQAVHRGIWVYLAAGLAACLVLSTTMTLWDMRHLRPVIEALDQREHTNSKILEKVILHKLNASNQLAIELEKSRNQIEHGLMEMLLRTGYTVSAADQALLSDQLQLTRWNYLLMIPAQQTSQEGVCQEVQLMLTTEQLYQCYGQRPYVHSGADGSILAILHLDDASGYPQLRQQTLLLQQQLDLSSALTLSAAFPSMEQLSSVYWQVRNAALNAEAAEKVVFLSSQDKAPVTIPEVTVLERLREYLLSGYTEQAQELVRQMFGQEVPRPQDFQQIFYSVRGVLLNAAEKTGCEDIAFLCNYDRRQSMQKLIQNLCDGCLVIGGHMDSLKQSHNLNLQKSILQWLGEHYQNPDLNAAMVADQFQISKKYVSQFLKDQTGKSYNEYVEDLRLNHAMELLKTSDLSVTEIATACGFSSQNTFYKAFRRRYDVSPSSIRRGLRQEDT